MIQNRTAVNGILAAVLSASVIPIHGALAKEKAPAAHKAAARPAATKHEKAEAPKDDAKPDDAGAPTTVTR
jgi:hypothetical protein